jgi:hypothetical protein
MPRGERTCLRARVRRFEPAQAFSIAADPPARHPTGGKYAGFGSTPDPPPQSNHPSFALSSHNAPSLDDIRNDPLKAASKGWGLFSAAVCVLED